MFDARIQRPFVLSKRSNRPIKATASIITSRNGTVAKASFGTNIDVETAADSSPSSFPLFQTPTPPPPTPASE